MLAVKIITPTGLYKECEAEALHVKTVEGELTLLSHHMPMVAMLATSRLQLRVQGDYQDYAIAGGLLHLHDDDIKILTDSIEGREEIDIERAKRAKERAEKRLQKLDQKTDVKRAEVALAKAINRIQIHEN